MVELLAPVGNMECLKAAINAGCDAVYLSGINFGARSFAGNFTNSELVTAINTCHLYGVKVYVTVNTLIYDIETDRFMKYIDFLHQNNVDAVIMQDIGMIDLVRKTYPNLEIHASTQLHIHNLEGAKLCSELGIKRVVLARETPIELIEEIKKNINIDIEVFVHGALCMSYSGQCLISALIGSRSGNRGTCAQICRMPYSLEIDNKIVENNQYLLSTKDLNTLENLDKIINSGVYSLKIEGRMKRPEYVYLITSIYRRVIDNYYKTGKINISNSDIEEMKKIFNRNFTKGFIFNEDNDNFINTYRPNHMGINIGKVIDIKDNKVTIKLNDNLNINDGIRIIGKNDTGLIVTNMFKNKTRIESANKNDIITLQVKDKVNIGDDVVKTTDHNQLKRINDNINIDKKINITGKCILKVGKPLKLILSDYKNTIEITSDYIVEQAIGSGTSIDRIKEQLNKLGDSIYIFDNLDIESDNNIFVSISKINELRRNAIELLNNKRLYKIDYIKKDYTINVNNYDVVNKKSILIKDYQDYLDEKDNYDIIYVDDKDLYDKINDEKCILKLSRVNEYLKELNNKLLVGELGCVYKYKNVDTDFSLNVFNSYAVAFLHSIGVNKITLSYELNYKQIKMLVDSYKTRYKKHPNLEVITDAFEEVMVCKYNILKKYNKKEGYLLDRFNNKYKVVNKDNLMYIYNYNKRNLKDDYYSIGINYVRKNI